MTTRDDYLTAVGIAMDLLAAPAVAEKWREPSALAGLSVAGLGAHLASQIERVTAAEPATGEPISLGRHFAESAWVGHGPEHEVNVAGRQKFEKLGEVGPQQVLDRAAAALEEVRALIATNPADHVVQLPWAGWNLRFDDLLTTRLLEIAVHNDDLAVSVGVPTPELPESVLFAVTDLLSRQAVRRHGPTAVLRALARSERAPRTISAL